MKTDTSVRITKAKIERTVTRSAAWGLTTAKFEMLTDDGPWFLAQAWIGSEAQPLVGVRGDSMTPGLAAAVAEAIHLALAWIDEVGGNED